jgi:hypothetical protein
VTCEQPHVSNKRAWKRIETYHSTANTAVHAVDQHKKFYGDLAEEIIPLYLRTYFQKPGSVNKRTNKTLALRTVQI